MLSRPGAFRLGSRRRASWNIAGVRLPMTMLMRAGGLFGIALCQGNRPRGLIRVSGERALVSSRSIILLTCVGSLVILPVIGSRMDERFAGAVCWRCFCRLRRFLRWI